MPRKPNTVAQYTSEDFPIDRRQPVAEQLYEVIRERIVSLELEPGAPITDSAIALAAGVSRTPAREALKRLEDEGLIHIYPSQGSSIAKIRIRLVEEAIFLREMLEPEVAARCAALRDRKALVDKLDEVTGRQRFAIEKEGGRRVYGLDEAFHQTLFQACSLEMTWRAVMTARGQMDRIHYLGKRTALVPRRALTQHLSIVEAIKKGDVAMARSRMLSHISGNRDILAKARQAKGEYFEND